MRQKYNRGDFLHQGDIVLSKKKAFWNNLKCTLKNEKVLELDGGDGCTTMWMYLKTQNCTLKK